MNNETPCFDCLRLNTISNARACKHDTQYSFSRRMKLTREQAPDARVLIEVRRRHTRIEHEEESFLSRRLARER
ncbi:hypothetical protein NDU88_004237 [Pleurodeles waltl]|uniref:Uncharacterized protein n=1 Tax=Pleurodeles waltl TaxID=8319 RepID=A0AAV7RIK1_PLEWA|nr:hypothetical protein NDU88_004237 [Pleurodeles waltl]